MAGWFARGWQRFLAWTRSIFRRGLANTPKGDQVGLGDPVIPLSENLLLSPSMQKLMMALLNASGQEPTKDTTIWARQKIAGWHNTKDFQGAAMDLTTEARAQVRAAEARLDFAIRMRQRGKDADVEGAQAVLVKAQGMIALAQRFQEMQDLAVAPEPVAPPIPEPVVQPVLVAVVVEADPAPATEPPIPVEPIVTEAPVVEVVLPIVKSQPKAPRRKVASGVKATRGVVDNQVS